MISSALRIEIEQWASRRNERALFRMARDGVLTPPMVARYIANATWLVHQTQRHLTAARDRSRELGQTALAEHFAHKIEEEEGHEAWGDADLESMRQLVAAPPTTTKALLDLDAYIEEMIEQEPLLYLSYIGFVEYVTVLLGPELLRNIEQRCGVARTSMTVVDNHVELDRDHAEENFGVIDEFALDPRQVDPMRNALAKITAYFDRFCEEVTEIEEARVRVSAA